MDSCTKEITALESDVVHKNTGFLLTEMPRMVRRHGLGLKLFTTLFGRDGKKKKSIIMDKEINIPK